MNRICLFVILCAVRDSVILWAYIKTFIADQRSSIEGPWWAHSHVIIHRVCHGQTKRAFTLTL